MPNVEPTKSPARNVLGRPLETCGCEPMTGFYRDGCCNTGPDDLGVHTDFHITDHKSPYEEYQQQLALAAK
jgi:uncharacterized protein